MPRVWCRLLPLVLLQQLAVVLLLQVVLLLVPLVLQVLQVLLQLLPPHCSVGGVNSFTRAPIAGEGCFGLVPMASGS